MKTKILLLIFAVSLAVLSCDKEDYAITETVFDADANTTNPEAGQEVVFTDYSEGVVSRLWKFQDADKATSTDKIANVKFSREGPVTCEIEVTYSDGVKQKKNIPIQVGNELYRRNLYSFEDSQAVMDAWQIWVSGIDPKKYPEYVNISIDNTPKGGALETTGCLKVNVLKGGNREIQLGTSSNKPPVNIVLKPNKKYTFGLYVKSPEYKKIDAVEVSNWTPDNTNTVGFVWYSPLPNPNASPKDDISNTWTYYTYGFSTTADDLLEKLAIFPTRRAENAWVRFKFIPKVKGTYYIDEISMQEEDIEP